MPQIKAKPAFHQEQVQIVDHAHRRPLHVSTFVLKCFRVSVESCSASPWNIGLKEWSLVAPVRGILGSKTSTSANISCTSRKSSGASFVVLRVCWHAWLAMNMPNGG